MDVGSAVGSAGPYRAQQINIKRGCVKFSPGAGLPTYPCNLARNAFYLIAEKILSYKKLNGDILQLLERIASRSLCGSGSRWYLTPGHTRCAPWLGSATVFWADDRRERDRAIQLNLAPLMDY